MAKDMLLADQSFLAFRDLLFRGEVRAGQLVSIAELVEKTGFPLAPVREAVKHAESAGLVRILPKRGVLVIEPTPDTIRSCFHLRCMLDQEGARILAARLGEAPMRALREEHAAVRDQAFSGITPELQQWAMAVDWKLHLALAGALGNPLAAGVYASNHDRITVLQQSRRLLPERIIPAMDEHLRIIDAVLAGREEDAMRAVRAHLSGTLRWWGIGLYEEG
ncbi:GntR family transcriptional regulator [Castellaniella denitrificans]|uniref:GntR family transcriptional regulator n=1 Tax=Castellaniella denitrificans TaxID=56119 RepID=UPI001ACC5030|nr:GntR family transcriptional regulator [Burkholderiales bacterium]